MITTNSIQKNKFTDFLLYNSLKQQIERENEDNFDLKLDEKEKDEMLENIKNKINKHEVVYALICSYYIDENLSELPKDISCLKEIYGIKYLKSGIKINIDSLPIILQRMILKLLRFE